VFNILEQRINNAHRLCVTMVI